MIRKLFVVGGNIAILAAFIMLFVMMNQMKPKPETKVVETKPPAAYVEEVHLSPVSLTVMAQGEVRPRREIALTPEVSGKIVFVSDKFVDGGIFKKGDLLVRLEDADYRLALTRARARVATALQALEVERAESELARQDFEELNGQRGSSASALTLRKPQLARAEAEYNAAKADLADAELALDRTQLRAPFDGRVRSIAANIGQFVSPGSRIGELFSTDVAEVRLPLSDSDLAKLRLPFAFSAPYGKGPEVRFTSLAAGQQRVWTGSLVRVAAAIDPGTRQISAIAQVKDPYGQGSHNGFPMAIGLFVTAEIAGPEIDNATVLPRIAVHEDGYVYTLNEANEVQRTPITVAASTAAGVVVIGGLDEGDRVVVSRLNVAVGTKITPLDPNNPDAAVEDASPATDLTQSADAGGDASQGAQQ
ncbi:MAG: efflux RND transporter periplasmic adaptor subunit [Parvularcula sp.]